MHVIHSEQNNKAIYIERLPNSANRFTKLFGLHLVTQSGGETILSNKNVMKKLKMSILLLFIRMSVRQRSTQQVIRENFESILNYFGLIKCKVLAPANLYHPVLPVRAKGKLFFLAVVQEMCHG